MKLSSRVARLGESGTIRVTRRTRELRAGGADIVDFGPGEPGFPSDPMAAEAVVRAMSADGFSSGSTRYTLAAGVLDLRRELAEVFSERYGAPWKGDRDALITVGGKGALFQLMLCLIEKQDEVVVPTPNWVSFNAQVEFAGGRIVGVPMDEETGFEILAEPLIQAVTPKTKLLLINSPCNPTGGVIRIEELQRLVAFCAERDIAVVCDEAYEGYVYGDRQHASIASVAASHPDHCILVGTFSKTYGMTGWRVGYALGPEKLLSAMTRLQGHAVTHPATFAMEGALAALRRRQTNEGQLEHNHRRTVFSARREKMVEGLQALPGFRCEKAPGAFYAFANVREVIDDPASPFSNTLGMAEYLLERAHTAVVPGSAFGSDDHLRFSYACPEERIRAGLERISECLSS